MATAFSGGPRFIKTGLRPLIGAPFLCAPETLISKEYYVHKNFRAFIFAIWRRDAIIIIHNIRGPCNGGVRGQLEPAPALPRGEI